MKLNSSVWSTSKLTNIRRKGVIFYTTSPFLSFNRIHYLPHLSKLSLKKKKTGIIFFPKKEISLTFKCINTNHVLLFIFDNNVLLSLRTKDLHSLSYTFTKPFFNLDLPNITFFLSHISIHYALHLHLIRISIHQM